MLLLRSSRSQHTNSTPGVGNEPVDSIILVGDGNSPLDRLLWLNANMFDLPFKNCAVSC